MLKNSKGRIYYGMHFYPGVAEYAEPGKDPYRVFLNEDTIRAMDPSFAGRPIFVEHVDEVDDDIDQLRKEADGWVVESFFNSADGKHWVKFIVVSERAEKAISLGMRLSNAYVPTKFSSGGLWNGVSYAKEITGGEFEHLAIVRNPRYEESVIMSPEEFKQYNDDKVGELKRLANSKDQKGESTIMKFNLFKKTKVENSLDIEGMSLVLPKSGKEVTLVQLVNEADELEDKKKKNEVMADMGHQVKLHDGSMCNVADLLAKHKAVMDELEALKKPAELPADEIAQNEEVEMSADDSMDNGDADVQLVEEKEKEVEAAKKKNELEAAAAKKKEEAKRKAEALRNAHLRDAAEEVATVEMSGDQVARGKSRYGSN